MRIDAITARDAMRTGSILIQQKGRKTRYFVEPGGEVRRGVFMALRLIPNVVANHDGGDGGSQSWRWTT